MIDPLDEFEKEFDGKLKFPEPGILYPDGRYKDPEEKVTTPMLDKALQQETGTVGLEKLFKPMTLPPDRTPEEIFEAFRTQGYMIVNSEPQPAIELTILGEPKFQQRHRHFKVGNFVKIYDPSAKDKDDFLFIVQNNAPQEPFNCPLRVDINAYFSHPKSHYKTGKNAHILKDNPPKWHKGRPDFDNVAKFVGDSLNKIYWKDDGCLCDVHVVKQYSLNPRTEIKIFVL